LRITPFLLFITCLMVAGGFAVNVRAQTPISSDTSHAKLVVDTAKIPPQRQGGDSTLPFTPKPENGLWRRPQVERDGGNLFYSGEAMRYYGTQNTLPELFEESGGPYPLVQSDEGFGRESFVMTSRTSEDIASTSMDGVLPMNSILNGVTMTNYFPIDVYSSIRMNSGAEGAAMTGADFASSDDVDFTIERFRAPVPYSRIHFTQDLSRDNSNFDGLFSLNTSRSTNFTFAISRHTSGSTPAPYDLSFDPRTDTWSVRGQMSVDKYLGTLPTDSTMTGHKIDSILATPAARAKTLDLLVWTQYTTAFSGLNGGIAEADSNDIFDQVNAPTQDDSTSDHRTRADALVELELPLLAEARTKLAGYGSYEARTIITPASTFPTFIPASSQGTRVGLMLDQPLKLALGDFSTSANIRGDAERIAKDSVLTTSHPITESRVSATASDSLALKTALRISLFGFARTVESNLSVAGGPISAAVLPSVGFAGSIGITDAISFHASYQYSKDRATLSPDPAETYQLRNLGGWFDAHFAFSKHDSLALHAGFLDRHEPQGIIYPVLSDTLTRPAFSNVDLHSQSYTLAFDAYLSKFHWGSSFTYFPSTVPISPYTQTPALEGNLPNRVFGFTGLYYENELGEGNMRFSIGPRVRFISQLDPQLTYDPASDYYVYRGYASSLVDSALVKVPDPRLFAPQAVFDFLLSAEVDRRAQISMSFLNILGAPYYNVALYPRDGFHWRIDVVWAFLD
jgi:hypothetical protein